MFPVIKGKANIKSEVEPGNYYLLKTNPPIHVRTWELTNVQCQAPADALMCTFSNATPKGAVEISVGPRDTSAFVSTFEPLEINRNELIYFHQLTCVQQIGGPWNTDKATCHAVQFEDRNQD